MSSVSSAAPRDSGDAGRHPSVSAGKKLVAMAVEQLPWLTDARPPERAQYYVFLFGSLDAWRALAGVKASDNERTLLALIRKTYSKMRAKGVSVIFILSPDWRHACEPESWALDIQEAKKLIKRLKVKVPCAFGSRLPDYPRIPGLEKTALGVYYAHLDAGVEKYDVFHGGVGGRIDVYACDSGEKYSPERCPGVRRSTFVGYASYGLVSICGGLHMMDNQGNHPFLKDDEISALGSKGLHHVAREVFKHWEYVLGLRDEYKSDAQDEHANLMIQIELMKQTGRVRSMYSGKR